MTLNVRYDNWSKILNPEPSGSSMSRKTTSGLTEEIILMASSTVSATAITE